MLFKPETALRVRWNTNTDTPIPPDEAAGKNPPDGALIDFYLARRCAGVVKLEILDRAAKTVIRQYSSDQVDEEVDLKNLQVPTYWARRAAPFAGERWDASGHLGYALCAGFSQRGRVADASRV